MWTSCFLKVILSRSAHAIYIYIYMNAIPDAVYEAMWKSFRADWVERQKSSHALHDFLADVNWEREVRKVAQPL